MELLDLVNCIVYDYSHADWDSLCDHLRDGRISLNLVHLLLLVSFVNGFRLELMYVSLIMNRSGLTHVYGFQLLVLLPEFIEITFFVCTNRIK